MSLSDRFAKIGASKVTQVSRNEKIRDNKRDVIMQNKQDKRAVLIQNKRGIIPAVTKNAVARPIAKGAAGAAKRKGQLHNEFCPK